MVDGNVGLFENRSALKLVGSHFVVSGLDRNAEPVGMPFEIFHELQYTAWDGSEVVVVELLVFCGDVSHEGPAGLGQIGAGLEQSFVHEKILLFPSQRHVDLCDILVEELTHVDSGFVEGKQRFEQRGLEVERFTCVGDENAGDTECLVENEGGRARVPCRISSGLERVAKTSGREA